MATPAPSKRQTRATERLTTDTTALPSPVCCLHCLHRAQQPPGARTAEQLRKESLSKPAASALWPSPRLLDCVVCFEVSQSRLPRPSCAPRAYSVPSKRTSQHCTTKQAQLFRSFWCSVAQSPPRRTASRLLSAERPQSWFLPSLCARHSLRPTLNRSTPPFLWKPVADISPLGPVPKPQPRATQYLRRSPPPRIAAPAVPPSLQASVNTHTLGIPRLPTSAGITERVALLESVRALQAAITAVSGELICPRTTTSRCRSDAFYAETNSTGIADTSALLARSSYPSERT